MNYNNITQPPYNSRPPGNYCWFCGGHINYSHKKKFYWLYPPGSLKPLGMVHRVCDTDQGDSPERVL